MHQQARKMIPPARKLASPASSSAAIKRFSQDLDDPRHAAASRKHRDTLSNSGEPEPHPPTAAAAASTTRPRMLIEHDGPPAKRKGRRVRNFEMTFDSLTLSASVSVSRFMPRVEKLGKGDLLRRGAGRPRTKSEPRSERLY